MFPSHKIYKTSDDDYVINIDATEDTGVYDGHFAGHPILPGVVQLDWVMKVSQEILAIAEPSAQDFQIKFSHIIEPGSIELRLKYVKGKIEFEYHAKNIKCSSGSIRVAGGTSS